MGHVLVVDAALFTPAGVFLPLTHHRLYTIILFWALRSVAENGGRNREGG
jgi:hypothetical protein